MPSDKRFLLAKARGVRAVELELFGADEDAKVRKRVDNARTRARSRDKYLMTKPLGGLTFDDFDRTEP